MVKLLQSISYESYCVVRGSPKGYSMMHSQERSHINLLSKRERRGHALHPQDDVTSDSPGTKPRVRAFRFLGLAIPLLLRPNGGSVARP
jgi:hypothetical protein